MDLVRSWAAAIGVWLVLALVSSRVFISFGSVDQLQSFGGRFTVIYLPTLLTALLCAAVAAAVHPRSRRGASTRHAVAALGVPALLAVTGVLTSILQGTGAEMLASGLLATVLGGPAGWWLADRLRSARVRRTASYGYPY